MEIPNYDSGGDNDRKFKQLFPFMPRFFFFECWYVETVEAKKLISFITCWWNGSYTMMRCISTPKISIKKSIKNDKVIPVDEMDYEDNQLFYLTTTYAKKIKDSWLIISFKGDIRIVRKFMSVKAFARHPRISDWTALITAYTNFHHQESQIWFRGNLVLVSKHSKQQRGNHTHFCTLINQWSHSKRTSLAIYNY